MLKFLYDFIGEKDDDGELPIKAYLKLCSLFLRWVTSNASSSDDNER